MIKDKVIIITGASPGIGEATAKLLAGHEVVFNYASSQSKLERLVRDAGGKARAGTPHEAAQDVDAVLLAVRCAADRRYSCRDYRLHRG